MKRLILIGIMIIMALTLIAEYKINKPYQFPIEHGSKEWLQLRRDSKIYNAYQIPEDILKNMTTNAILETFITLPFIDHCLGYDNRILAFKGTCRRFNSYHELILRDDYKQTLML